MFKDFRSNRSHTLSAQPGREPSPTGIDSIAKRGFDLAVGGTLFVLVLPVIVLAWLAVRLSSRGPGVYTQTRLGRGGRRFVIYKLRSMYHNVERVSGIQWSQKGDPRVTPVGRFLRASHIDELPQLWNIVRGDMSLVGPRPERPELVGALSDNIEGYCDRLLVRPGLTGLAQIQLPPDSNQESVRRKLVLDLCYVEQTSIWLDLRILVATLFYVVGVPYEGVRRLAGLPNPLVVSSPLPAAVALCDSPSGIEEALVP